jgi:hypothetical protein
VPPPSNCLIFWLRGLDLNQRPLGYEYETAMTGNPLISWETYAAASSSTLPVDASLFSSFRPVLGCYGSKTGAARRVAHGPGKSLDDRYGRDYSVIRWMATIVTDDP